MIGNKSTHFKKNLILFFLFIVIVLLFAGSILFSSVKILFQALPLIESNPIQDIPQNICLRKANQYSKQTGITDASGMFITFQGRIENICNHSVENPSPRIAVYQSDMSGKVLIKPYRLPNTFSFNKVIEAKSSVVYDFSVQIAKDDVKEGMQYVLIFQ